MKGIIMAAIAVATLCFGIAQMGKTVDSAERSIAKYQAARQAAIEAAIGE